MRFNSDRCWNETKDRITQVGIVIMNVRNERGEQVGDIPWDCL